MPLHEPLDSNSQLDYSKFPSLKKKLDDETVLLQNNINDRKLVLKKRSTLNLTAALKFKSAFDDAIATKQDIKIYNHTSSTAESFRIKVAEALKYCVMALDNEHKDYKGRDHKQGDYARLRGQCKIKCPLQHEEQNHVKLLQLFNYEQIRSEVIDRNETLQDTWKEKLLNWISEPTTGVPFTINGINLNEDELIFTRDIILKFKEASVGIYNLIHVVEHDKIIVLVNLKEGV